MLKTIKEDTIILRFLSAVTSQFRYAFTDFFEFIADLVISKD